MAFARPMFWSEDLSVPGFVAVRPLTDEQIVAIKMKVAATSVAIAWLMVVCFVGVWLSLWANVDAVSQLTIQWWAFHEHSVLSVYGTVALILIAGVVLTWRFLVSRLWSGLSGSRSLFMASVMSAILVVMAGMVFAADRLPRWVLDDPTRMAGVVWLMSIAVVVKCWLAAYSWRQVPARHARRQHAYDGGDVLVAQHAEYRPSRRKVGHVAQIGRQDVSRAGIVGDVENDSRTAGQYLEAPGQFHPK